MAPSTAPPNSIKVGPFWWVDGHVVGLAVPVAQAVSVGNLFDSEQNHAELWDELKEREPRLLKFVDAEYFTPPRGRVLYDRQLNKHRVYLDGNLLVPERKAAIAGFFGFLPSRAVWKTDVHYTTSAPEIDSLFRD